MRLIDADALTRRFKVRGCFNKEMLGYMVAKVINSAPTVDAVEVVRCKDCKHFHTETVEEQTPYGFTNDKKVCGCMLHGEWVDVFVDDFCSYGERKEK